MTDLRIALFSGNYHHIRDGVSLTLNRLVAFLQSKGIEVLIVAPKVRKPAMEHVGKLIGAPSVPMPGRPEYKLTTGLPKAAIKELNEFKPHLVHIATPDRLGHKALYWAMENNIPAVSSYHTHFASYLDYYKLNFLENWVWNTASKFYDKCEQVYIPSESMAELLAEHGISKGVRIWARGVETDLFTPEKRSEDWRKEHGFTQDDIVVSFVSRIVWEKELATYAKAVSAISAKNPRVKAMVVGDGPALEGLKEMLPDATYIGFVKGDDLATAYANSDVFMFPSHTETFGNVTLEAMSSGLPCVVADAIGSKSLVEDGVNGFLAEKQSVESFTNCLDKVTSDDELRGKMALASREKALGYRWEIINSNLLSYYMEVLESKGDLIG